jgi:hypothetical protein
VVARPARHDRALSTAEAAALAGVVPGFGIRTLATGQAVYNPLSYHNGTVWPHDNAPRREGPGELRPTALAARVFDGLLEAMHYFRDRRLPELFCGMPQTSGNLVRYPVACSPQAWASAAIPAAAGGARPARRRASPPAPDPQRLPATLDGLRELEGLRIGETRVTQRLRRDGERVHVERPTSPARRSDRGGDRPISRPGADSSIRCRSPITLFSVSGSTVR